VRRPRQASKYTDLAVSSTAVSYTAQCLKLKQDKVDLIQLDFTASAAGKFVKDCQAQDYNPSWGTSEEAITKDFLKIANLSAVGPAYASPSTADSAPVKTFRDAMAKYAKGDNWQEGTGSFAWQGLELIRKALANAPANPTRQDVLAGLYSVESDNLGGLLADAVTYTKGNGFGSQPCYFVMVRQGRQDDGTERYDSGRPAQVGADSR
jgi:branched-chain amino acid transport system substrate-binding protein